MDVLGIQFAGFMPIAHLVPHWDCEWVEYAISAGGCSAAGGGLKPPRSEMASIEREELIGQGELFG